MESRLRPVAFCCLLALAAVSLCPALVRAQTDSGSDESSIELDGIEATDEKTFRLRYVADGEVDSVDIPRSLLISMVDQLKKSRANTTAPRPNTAVDNNSLPAPARRRAYAKATSGSTGKTYDVELIADSLLTLQYQEAGVDRVFRMPADILPLLHRNHEMLTGRVLVENEVYLEPNSGTFWFTISRGFNYKVVVFVLGLLIAAFLMAAIHVVTRRIRRERDDLKASRRRMLRIREAERSHLASELHDGPVQDVQRILRSNLSSLARVIPTSDTDDLTELESTLRQVAGSLRNICSDLKPPVLAHFGLEKAAESCVRTFRLRNPDVHVIDDLTLGPDELPEEARLVAYRILQEALNNVEKHAKAKTVRVELTAHGDEVRLSVADDGRGFRFSPRYSKLEERGHFGLSGMRQRVDSIGGMLYVDSVVGKGTRITVLIPSIVSEGMDLSAAAPIL